MNRVIWNAISISCLAIAIFSLQFQLRNLQEVNDNLLRADRELLKQTKSLHERVMVLEGESIDTFRKQLTEKE